MGEFEEVKRLEKWAMKFPPIYALEETQSLESSLRKFTALDRLLIRVEVWKYLVLRSLQVKQASLDLERQRISSLPRRFSKSNFKLISWSKEKGEGGDCWTESKRRRVALICLWMLPKWREFHFSKANLVFLSFLGRHLSGKPRTILCQAASIIWPQEESLIQNSSNLKGLGKKQEVLLVLRVMGLWLELRAKR